MFPAMIFVILDWMFMKLVGCCWIWCDCCNLGSDLYDSDGIFVIDCWLDQWMHRLDRLCGAWLVLGRSFIILLSFYWFCMGVYDSGNDFCDFGFDVYELVGIPWFRCLIIMICGQDLYDSDGIFVIDCWMDHWMHRLARLCGAWLMLGKRFVMLESFVWFCLEFYATGKVSFEIQVRIFMMLVCFRWFWCDCCDLG